MANINIGLVNYVLSAHWLDCWLFWYSRLYSADLCAGPDGGVLTSATRTEKKFIRPGTHFTGCHHGVPTLNFSADPTLNVSTSSSFRERRIDTTEVRLVRLEKQTGWFVILLRDCKVESTKICPSKSVIKWDIQYNSMQVILTYYCVGETGDRGYCLGPDTKPRVSLDWEGEDWLWPGRAWEANK